MMNAHIITLYVLIGVLILALAFIIYKSFAVESKLRHVLNFINGEVFSERFQEVIRIFINQERGDGAKLAPTTPRAAESPTESLPNSLIHPGDAKEVSGSPNSQSPNSQTPIPQEDQTQYLRIPKLTQHLRDHLKSPPSLEARPEEAQAAEAQAAEVRPEEAQAV